MQSAKTSGFCSLAVRGRCTSGKSLFGFIARRRFLHGQSSLIQKLFPQVPHLLCFAMLWAAGTMVETPGIRTAMARGCIIQPTLIKREGQVQGDWRIAIAAAPAGGLFQGRHRLGLRCGRSGVEKDGGFNRPYPHYAGHL